MYSSLKGSLLSWEVKEGGKRWPHRHRVWEISKGWILSLTTWLRSSYLHPLADRNFFSPKMFAAHHPSTSPASFETSYLQQQMNQGRTTLNHSTHPSTRDHPHSALSTSPSNISIEEGERGRKLSNGKKSSRTSVSSAYSHERRLSPTRESINESDDTDTATEGETERISILPVNSPFYPSLSLS